MTKLEAGKEVIRELCMEIIGLSYESKPDPVKILNRSMALANANSELAREWCAELVLAESKMDGERLARLIRESNK